MKRLRAWCRREGNLDAWPRKIREVLRAFACEHGFEFLPDALGGMKLKSRDVIETFAINGECASLDCRCCYGIIAAVRGNEIRTIAGWNSMPMKTKEWRDWLKSMAPDQ